MTHLKHIHCCVGFRRIPRETESDNGCRCIPPRQVDSDKESAVSSIVCFLVIVHY